MENNLEKLKVSRDVAWALKDLIGRSRKEYPFEYIINHHASSKRGESEKWTGEKWKSLNDLSLAEMAHAIYVGYEVEETMEDKLGKIFKRTEQQKNYSDSEVRLILLEALEVVGLNVPEDYWMYN